jgi:hypothetical protein
LSIAWLTLEDIQDRWLLTDKGTAWWWKFETLECIPLKVLCSNTPSVTLCVGSVHTEKKTQALNGHPPPPPTHTADCGIGVFGLVNTSAGYHVFKIKK